LSQEAEALHGMFNSLLQDMQKARPRIEEIIRTAEASLPIGNQWDAFIALLERLCHDAPFPIWCKRATDFAMLYQNEEHQERFGCYMGARDAESWEGEPAFNDVDEAVANLKRPFLGIENGITPVAPNWQEQWLVAKWYHKALPTDDGGVIMGAALTTISRNRTGA
jgi:hypothetical protein